ncbi:hypothetical protein [Mucilaginibacter sp. FT3.2]|uniref:GAP1-N1 domain-containing protein n=1 Tax=Mucilaginibacter sp. FT3.2 TaxID=2723090 RepID=UPI0016163E21|nr:hypothetical protein [Mucilaginibacter sp. FT3.2]MBB6232424.1 hypothetical protein [Mucilaginibacter sp. FT3.2]
MNNDTLILSQTLHGYSDGHTLLASSVELPAEARRIMLNLSDMSSGNMERGFEEYITGYPLKEANLYAIAKTWYAPEMPRPGCVWTHSILVNFSDLPRIANTGLLLSLFVRPNLNNFDGYRSPVLVTEEITRADEYNVPIGLIKEQLIKTLIKQLYSLPGLPLVLTSPNSFNFDSLFLMLWRQQWPRLRRNFSFCTGAVAPRSLYSQPLDLQVIPFNLDTTNNQNLKATNIKVTQEFEYNDEKWVQLAFEDLSSPSVQLKRFLNYFGSDVEIKRTAFQTLLRSFTFFKDDRPRLTDGINFLAEQFPSSKDGVNLKTALLSGESNIHSTVALPYYDESTIVYQLAITENYKSFNYTKLNFFDRFLRCFEDLNESTIEVLKQIIRQSPNPLGEEAITSLAGVVSGSALHSIWKDRQLATVFIGLNPKLTFNKDFWLANTNNQQEIINQLHRAGIDDIGWKTICSILIDIDSKIDPKILSDKILGLENIILDKINESNTPLIGNNWIKFIKNNSSAILGWIKDNHNLSPRTIDILIDILDPNATPVIKNGIYPWLSYLSLLSPAQLTSLKIDVHVFCLSLAFNINSEETQPIFSLLFEKVYFALATDSIDYHLWRNLEVHTKPLSWLKDWDKCKKLINALVDYFIKNGMSIKRMVADIHNGELKEKILTQYKKRK